jgi:hypothetical protein
LSKKKDEPKTHRYIRLSTHPGPHGPKPYPIAWGANNPIERGPRLIIMCLGNLLWNLQHPVDIQSGFPLGLDDKIALCRDVGVYINRLLDTKTKPELKQFDYDGEFINFVRQVETYTSELKFAYEEEKLHSLNMSEVTSRAHGTARILNNNIFKLVYKEDRKAMDLAATIGYLNQLLKRDQGIFSVLSRFDYDNTLVNRPPRTIMDILIVFTHLSYKDRKHFISILNDKHNMTRLCFATTLKTYNNDFLKPIYNVCKKELDDGFLHSRKKSAQNLAAKRLLPLVGLAIEDYRIDIDTNETRSASHRAKRLKKPFLTAKEQLEQITAMAYHNELNPTRVNPKNAYGWHLSSYLNLNPCLDENINELPRKQYKIGELTELLDAIQSFISQYRSFLQYSQFKNFVIHCLQTIGEEFSSLRWILTKLEADINVDTTEDRRLIDTIKTMDQNLLTEISKFTTVVKSLEEKMSAPDFEENIRKEVVHKLNGIEKQFHKAFGRHEPGLTSFIQALSGRSKAPQPIQPSLNPIQEIRPAVLPSTNFGQVSRVSSLVTRCYFALSNDSRKGRKGHLLLDLERRISKQKTLNVMNIREIVLELTRMVCAYRPGFFEKPYAHTRSAVVLIDAILDSVNDKTFPLATFLFGDEIVTELQVTNSQRGLIQEKLGVLRDDNLWAFSSEYLLDSQLFAS